VIISVTLNPAVDQTAWVDRLEAGSVHRVRETHIDPAGKGINVSRMAHRLGWPTIAFGFLAGDVGNIVRKALEQEGVPAHFVPIPGQTRINVTVVEDSGTSSSFYGPGPAAPPEGLASLEGLVRFWLQAGGVLVLAGSLPSGVPEDVYARLTRAARERGVKVFLDADGEPLRLGLDAGPSLIKPNVEEAERLLGRPLPDETAILAAARELVGRGVETVIISMGGRGAVCAQGARVWRIHPPDVKRLSTVGSGDAMVAGIAVAMARGEDLVRGLALGTAAGAATAMSEGTALGTADDVADLLPQVRIEEMS
jgi:1-phosphofructokinase family hexose kinase